MNYITSKTYSFTNRPFAKLFGISVALVDYDTVTRNFYSKKLEDAGVFVHDFENLLILENNFWGRDIYALIFSTSTERVADDVTKLTRFVRKFPNLPIMTLAPTVQNAHLDAIMKLGSRIHINRDFSHPRDILIALEQIV